jgi:hypothetical protein
VTTLEGNRVEGIVSVESASSLLVTPKDGPPTRVELSNVLDAQMAAGADEPDMARGVVLTDGSALAAATFRRADADTVKLVPDIMNAEVSIKAVRVARIVFGAVSRDALAAVPPASSGVLLESGDFVEGEFAGLQNGKIKISSVLFGIQSFDAGRPAKAVILRDAKPPAAALVDELLNGSILPVDGTLVLDRAATRIERTPFGTVSVPFDQIARISAGGERIVRLTSLGSPGSTKPNSAGAPPQRLIGSTRPADSVIFQEASTTLNYDLNGRFDSFITEVGVPAGLVPRQHVQITVLCDGRRVFASDSRTSVDDALAVAVSVRGVNKLTLQLNSTGAGAPAIWLDPILVKTSH